MKLCSYDRYYEMTDEELEKEIKKYKMGDFSNDATLRKNRIEQLIAKDNNSMFKRSLIISVFTLMVVIISSVISIIAILIKYL